MTDTVTITRRGALMGALTGVAATGMGLGGAGRLLAEGGAGAIDALYTVGDFKVVTLLDGVFSAGDPQKTFGMNVGAEEFAKASAAAFIPADSFRGYFTPTLVDTGSEVILFDTGRGGDAGGTAKAAAMAGYPVDKIDVVVITHFHPDHIGGLMTGGAPTYPNARYVIGAVEHNFWGGMAADANRITKLMATNVTPIMDKASMIEAGGAVASGVTAMDMSGHTPGHTGYMIESGGQQLVLTADLANHHVWSVAHPDWEVRFDMDKAAAAARRKEVLGMIAADKLPFVGYHMPFPALGYLETAGSGFRYVPATYQLKG